MHSEVRKKKINVEKIDMASHQLKKKKKKPPSSVITKKVNAKISPSSKVRD